MGLDDSHQAQVKYMLINYSKGGLPGTTAAVQGQHSNLGYDNGSGGVNDSHQHK
jgi:hypothetical protein